MGILSLSEHALDAIPMMVFEAEIAKKLRTLDLSKNNLSGGLERLGTLVELKILNLDHNNLLAGCLESVKSLGKLQNLSVSGNKIGKPSAIKSTAQPLPELPSALKQLNLSSNFLSCVPRPVVSVNLIRMEKLDLSSNQITSVPAEISNLAKLEELRLDSNMIVSVPEAMGLLSKLKVLSLRGNQLQVTSTTFDDKTNIQPLPKSLFTDTLLIDLNLHGNRLTNTQMNEFDGYQDFLDRRQKVKSKIMSNFDVCGLE